MLEQTDKRAEDDEESSILDTVTKEHHEISPFCHGTPHIIEEAKPWTIHGPPLKYIVADYRTPRERFRDEQETILKMSDDMFALLMVPKDAKGSVGMDVLHKFKEENYAQLQELFLRAKERAQRNLACDDKGHVRHPGTEDICKECHFSTSISWWNHPTSLIDEGCAREIMRRIQVMRKKMDLEITEEVVVLIEMVNPPTLWEEEIRKKTRAKSLIWKPPSQASSEDKEYFEAMVMIEVSRIGGK